LKDQTKIYIFLITAAVFMVLTIGSGDNLVAAKSECGAELKKCQKTCVDVKGDAHGKCLLKCYQTYNECKLD